MSDLHYRWGFWTAAVIAILAVVREMVAWFLRRPDQAHEEAKAIWADASAFREEQRREIEALRTKAEHTEATHTREMEALEARLEHAERQRIEETTALRQEIEALRVSVETLRRHACLRAVDCTNWEKVAA